MAKTFQTLGLKPTTPGQPSASWLRQTLPKASATTFPVGSPIKMASGLVLEWVNPSDADIVAFAVAAGVNGDTEVECIYAMPDVILEATFLGAAAADNVLAAADLWISGGRDLLKAANLLGTGVAGWYISDAAADAGVDIVAFDYSPNLFPTGPEAYKPEAGDTNARVRAHVRPGVSAWY